MMMIKYADASDTDDVAVVIIAAADAVMLMLWKKRMWKQINIMRMKMI